MKRHLILLLLSYCSVEGYARNLYQPLRNTTHFPGEITTAEILATQASINTANKTTALPLRLLGWGYSMNGTEIDSAWNYYSGGRGSVHPNRATYTNEYTPGNPQYIQSDSSIYWELQGASLKFKNFRSCVYDNNNKVTGFYYREAAYSYKQNVSYNNGLISGITTYDSILGSFNPARQSIRTYNAQGYLITDSFYNLPSNNPFYKIKYGYDVNNNLVLQESYEYKSGGWHLTYRITNTYNNNLLITTVREIEGAGGTMVNNTRDSFGYSGTNVINESAFDWDVPTSSWRPGYRTTYHFNAQNFVDTFYVQEAGNNKWDTTEKDALVYDSNNLLTHSAGYLFQNDSFATTPYDNQNYYYETYFPAGINTVTAKEVINIYPNPSSGMLHISTKLDNGEVEIINTQGQLMLRQEHIPLFNAAIDIQALPKGNYIIQIKATNGYISQKQFVKI